jgi:hypothetical protein
MQVDGGTVGFRQAEPDLLNRLGYILPKVIAMKRREMLRAALGLAAAGAAQNRRVVKQRTGSDVQNSKFAIETSGKIKYVGGEF